MFLHGEVNIIGGDSMVLLSKSPVPATQLDSYNFKLHSHGNFPKLGVPYWGSL